MASVDRIECGNYHDGNVGSLRQFHDLCAHALGGVLGAARRGGGLRGVTQSLLWLAFLPVYAAVFLILSRNCPRLTVDLRTANGMINLLNGVLIQILLLIGYTAFFFLLERGLSLRVSIEISRAPQGRMKLAEIMRVYTLRLTSSKNGSGKCSPWIIGAKDGGQLHQH